MVDQTRIDELRRRLFEVTPLRAEELKPGELDERGWYVDVFAGRADDPILEIAERLAWSDHAICVGLTGATGVGKTTQLGRLGKLLREKHGIVCVTVDYGKYNVLSSPPDITDFLLSVTAGFATEAAFSDLLPPEWDRASVGQRMRELLGRLKLPDIVLKAGGTNIAFQDLLRQDQTFRALLREHAAGRVTQLIQEVHNFTGELVSLIKAQSADIKGVALIVDSTEKLAAPGSLHEQMQTAVRNLFVQNGDNLALPELHTVHLVPPWLPVSDGGALRIPLFQFPAVQVEHRQSGHPPDPVGLAVMDDIVRARMPDVSDFIKPGDLKQLCRMSGGIQRVLFQLLHTVAGTARSAPSLPVPSEIVEGAIVKLQQDYLAVTIEAAPWLQRIQQTNGLDGLPASALTSLGAYFQSMVVVQWANGGKWYGIHPLMRDRVKNAQLDE